MRKQVLIIYYSFTQQTRILVKQFAEGLAQQNVDCVLERIVPEQPFELPFASNWSLLKAMVQTFLRKRLRIAALSENCSGEFDCVILAGPTWSYFPSGPVLDFIDKYGKEICGGKVVVPIISCRSYWRIHFYNLKYKLVNCGATVLKPIVFVHPIKEPWRIVGLLLQLRGKMVRKKDSWFRKHYPGYGHNKEQVGQAKAAGIELGACLHRGEFKG